MKKNIIDFKITNIRALGSNYGLMVLTPADGSAVGALGMHPGQFMQIDTDARGVMLRRPISICDVDLDANTVTLLVRNAGKGTAALIAKQPGATVNAVVPLGNGFSACPGERPLLIGGGVGVAPLLFLARQLCSQGIKPDILLGARSEADLLLVNEFNRYGTVYLSTDDGSAGQEGVVTQNTILDTPHDVIYCCGPLPMMKAVAAVAKAKGTDCEVSLENKMACGIGACLCCVEDTAEHGNVCVCTDGPVFNINRLKW